MKNHTFGVLTVLHECWYDPINKIQEKYLP